jgi:hypothetical protein
LLLAASFAIGLVGLLAPPVAASPAAPARDERAWAWPVDPVDVLRGFEAPDGPYGPGHRGVDLAVEPEQAVTAPRDGTVTFSGLVAGTPVVVVSHGELRSTFQPVLALLPRGTHVEGGDAVGTAVLDVRHCDQPCVHWGVLRGDDYLDPAALVSPGAARLLPYLADGWTDGVTGGRRSGGSDGRESRATPVHLAGADPPQASTEIAGPADRLAAGEPPGRVPAAVGIALALTGAVSWAVAARWRRPP